MKKLKLLAVACILIVATAFVSCSNDDDDNSVDVPQAVLKTEFVTEVTGAETGIVNQEVILTITYVVGGDCSELSKVIETASGNTKKIEIEVKYDKTKYCTQPTTQTFDYKFKATAAGTYLLRFKKSATEFITHTIVVS